MRKGKGRSDRPFPVSPSCVRRRALVAVQEPLPFRETSPREPIRSLPCMFLVKAAATGSET